jgi:hypothetical protein
VRSTWECGTACTALAAAGPCSLYIDETAEQTIDLARGAMESYLDFFQKTMFASPWAQTDLNKKIQSYAGKNLASTFEFAQKLTRVKDLQELVQIQTEFMQTQLKAANKGATAAFKGRSGPSS